jgi:hypothetical protein
MLAQLSPDMMSIKSSPTSAGQYIADRFELGFYEEFE